eukprot:TRINITY_DN17543_c0_g1_i2.p1 TRINITY_DN17543_c0_g1~~TRINITY_DN17543_c0_g1_i2.p1  ORF type:complete len:536 (-),score=96.73 TRINITY_DN17543_c0_g1_i2:452-2059(-)
MAILGMQGGIGRLVGPVLAALLYDPASNYDAFDTSFWRANRFLLPDMAAAVVVLVSIVGSYCFLVETLERPKRCCAPFKQQAGGPKEEQGEQLEFMEHRQAPPEPSTQVTVVPGYRALLSDTSVLLTTTLYGLVGGAGMLCDELFPLWVMTPTEAGGFALDTQQIGLILACGGPFQLISQLAVFPVLVGKVGVKRLFEATTLWVAVVVCAMPWTSLTNTAPAAVYWVLLVLAFSMMACGRVAALTSLFVLINNSVLAPQRGTVNGIGQSFAAIGRFVGPWAGASLFAWTQGNSLRWPLNYHLTWYAVAVVAVLSSGLCYFILPSSLEKSKLSPSDQDLPGDSSASVAMDSRWGVVALDSPPESPKEDYAPVLVHDELGADGEERTCPCFVGDRPCWEQEGERWVHHANPQDSEAGCWGPPQSLPEVRSAGYLKDKSKRPSLEPAFSLLTSKVGKLSVAEGGRCSNQGPSPSPRTHRASRASVTSWLPPSLTDSFSLRSGLCQVRAGCSTQCCRAPILHGGAPMGEDAAARHGPCV